MSAPAYRYLFETIRDAQDCADRTRLPQTVYYHPDVAYGWMPPGNALLRAKDTKQCVTWLPANYFS